MTQNVQGPQPGGIPPQGPTPAQPAQFPQTGSGQYMASLEVWNQMFGGKASVQELKAIMNGVIQDSMNRMRHDQQRAIEAIRKLRRAEEGKEE